MLPLTINIKEAYANGKDDEQKFIQNLSLFLFTFLKEHGQLVEKKVCNMGSAFQDDLFNILVFQYTLRTCAKTSVQLFQTHTNLMWTSKSLT